MAYTAREWKDGAAGGTPVDAANLNRMEQGIATAMGRLPLYEADTAASAVPERPCILRARDTGRMHYVPASGDAQDVSAALSAEDRAWLTPRRISPKANEALANFSSYASHSFVFGDVLFLHMVIGLTKATDWNSDDLLLFTLPEGCRPVEDTTLLRVAQLVTADGATFWCTCTASPDGKVRVDTDNTKDVKRAVVSVPIRMNGWATQQLTTIPEVQDEPTVIPETA